MKTEGLPALNWLKSSVPTMTRSTRCCAGCWARHNLWLILAHLGMPLLALIGAIPWKARNA